MVNTYDTIELDYHEVPSDNLTDTHAHIDRVDGTISYSDFFKKYMLSNKPCIIKLSSAESWECLKEWVSHNSPNFDYLLNVYGNTNVPVADCGVKYYNVQKKCFTPFAEFLKYWKDYKNNGYPTCMPCLYLKDWHFTKDFPEHYVYRVPQYFASDWLNEFLCSKPDDIDDYRFVYMGPKGSWTPLHADVFTSFSWSINICGKKRWILFPPGQEEYLKDYRGNLIYDVESSILYSEIYPHHSKLSSLEVLQEAGEAIFVPTGWHHQVWNVEDTISINHNWVNGCNIHKMWQCMQNNLNDVKKEIEDCCDMENWDDHCQVMLQAVFGMNYEEFYKFLEFISLRRLEYLNNNQPLVVYGNWVLGTHHIIFDLQQIKDVLENFFSNNDVQNLHFYKISHERLKQMYIEVENTLQKFSVKEKA